MLTTGTVCHQPTPMLTTGTVCHQPTPMLNRPKMARYAADPDQQSGTVLNVWYDSVLSFPANS